MAVMGKPRTDTRTATRKKRESEPKATPGPKPEILKIEGDWQQAVKKSLTKKKPASGWPSH